MQVRTPGGVIEVQWDERGTATAMGRWAFFAEHLEDTDLFITPLARPGVPLEQGRHSRSWARLSTAGAQGRWR